MNSWVGLIVIALVVWMVVSENRRANRKRKSFLEAHRAYQEHLEQLKDEPTDPALRQETLRLGRLYSNLTRNNQGVTIFDEVALANDINAACAAAASPHRAKEGSGSQSIEERLEKLVRLRDRGLISMTEWAERRKEILKDV